MISEKQLKMLILKAINVRNNAYSPYSRYKVGAALLSKSGKIYVGANYENSSFGAGICAERVALGSAIAAGERNFEAICICGDNEITPCGICRQALVEFDDMEVICSDGFGNYKRYMLSDMIPLSFKYVQNKL